MSFLGIQPAVWYFALRITSDVSLQINDAIIVSIVTPVNGNLNKEVMAMMNMRINGGSMSITDDNKTIASANVAKQINDACVAPDAKENDDFKPDITVKD